MKTKQNVAMKPLMAYIKQRDTDGPLKAFVEEYIAKHPDHLRAGPYLDENGYMVYQFWGALEND